MESEKILMAAGVTVAAVVGAFVFWGPSGKWLQQRVVVPLPIFYNDHPQTRMA